MYYVIKKRVEPYVLLETVKNSFEMRDFTFDGFNKETVKKEFLKTIEKSNSFGLYMKNVNKFYLFHSHTKIDILKLLIDKIGLTSSDFYSTEDKEEPFRLVDNGKAEAAVICRQSPDEI